MIGGERPGNRGGANPGDRGGPHTAAPAAASAGTNPQLSPITHGPGTNPTSPSGEPRAHHREQRLRAPAELLQIASRLTDRDLQIASFLNHHDVFTTDQLTRLFFTHPTSASHRLISLYRIRWIARFRRPKPAGGTTAWHWVLGPLGAQWHAAANGENPPTPEALRRRWVQLAASPQLGHRLGVHDFFVDLHAYATSVGVPAAWWSARQTADRFLQRVRPDGAGRYGDTWFFVEHDTGTETISRLVAKLDAYAVLRGDGGPAWPVLFHLPNLRREANLHAALSSTRLIVPVATAVHGNHPAARAWRVAGNGNRRYPLSSLPSGPASNPLYRNGDA